MSAGGQRLAVDRARQAVIALGALVVCAAAVAAAVLVVITVVELLA